MAQKVDIFAVCDPCDHLGLSGVPAAVKHVITLDRQSAKEFDFCARCEIAFAPLLEILREHGQEIQVKHTPLQQKRHKRSPAKAVAGQEEAPKELEQALPAEVEAPKEKQYVICMEPHGSLGGEPLQIDYVNRNSHTSQCHPEKKIWEIEWGDPDKILKFACDVHAECVKHPPLAFTTPQGLSSHKHSSPLPRTDGGADE